MRQMPHKALVIETTETTLTALEISGGAGCPEIRRLISESLPTDGLNGVWLRQLWQRQNFSTTRVIWMLSETLVRYQTLTFMMLPEEQLAAAVRVELESNGGAADLWRIIGSQPQGDQIRVRVALVADARLTQALAPIRAAGLEVLWSGFYCRGLQNFILFHQDLWEAEDSRHAYLYLTDDWAEYGVVSEANLFYRRILKLGSRDLTGSEAAVVQTDLITELRLSIAASCNTGGPKAGRLWLFGVDQAALVDLATALTGIGPEVVLPSKTHLSGGPLQDNIPRLAPLIGLALDGLGWNKQENWRLFTKEQQQSQMTRLQINWTLKFALVGAFLLLGGWLLAQAKLTAAQKSEQWLKQQTVRLIRLQRAEARTQVNLSKVRKLERWSGQKGRELEFLQALQRQLPEDTVITDLTIEAGRVKNLAGTTPSVSLLLGRLETAADPSVNRLQLKGKIIKTENGFEGFQLEDKTGSRGEQSK